MASTAEIGPLSSAKDVFWTLAPIAAELHADLPYHGFHHPLETFKHAWGIAQDCLAAGHQTNLRVVVAGPLLHDAGLHEYDSSKFRSPEEYAAQLADVTLRPLNFSDEEIALVQEGIRATEVGVKPQSLEAKILRRADLWNLQDYHTLLRGTYLVIQESCNPDGKFPDVDQVARAKAKALDLLPRYLNDDEPLFPADEDRSTKRSHFRTKAQLALATMAVTAPQDMRLQMRNKLGSFDRKNPIY